MSKSCVHYYILLPCTGEVKADRDNKASLDMLNAVAQNLSRMLMILKCIHRI